MDEEEDDVLVMDTYSWRPPIREIKQEERGTQTPGRSLAQSNGMLPCGVSEEPRHLFYGSAGLLLLTQSGRSDHLEEAMLQEDHHAMEPLRQNGHSIEARIGQKLQLIGDQFYQDHMLQHRNQRNQQPFWLRLASALYTLLFEREPVAHGRRVVRR
ncbi:BCL2 modifying factor 1 [Hoplias malabaricus]|uniref:BCL2 modifying factor 1 n=1 Tax=Hoplias malabaricus TaxID=27720 RepID=UPI0034621ADC